MLQFMASDLIFYEITWWAPCYEYQNMILMSFKYYTSVDTIKERKEEKKERISLSEGNVNGVQLNGKVTRTISLDLRTLSYLTTKDYFLMTLILCIVHLKLN